MFNMIKWQLIEPQSLHKLSTCNKLHR